MNAMPDQRRVVRFVVSLSILAVIILIITNILPGVGSREPHPKTICLNNLRQLGLAVQQYAAVHGAYPPAYTVDEDGNRLHSWRTLILPYLDYEILYDLIDLSKPWNDLVNAEARAISMTVYRCPTSEVSQTKTTYLAVLIPGGGLQPVESRPLSDVTEPDETPLLVEVDASYAVHWMSPFDADERLLERMSDDQAEPHDGGRNFLFASGIGMFLSQEAWSKFWRQREAKKVSH